MQSHFWHFFYFLKPKHTYDGNTTVLEQRHALQELLVQLPLLGRAVADHVAERLPVELPQLAVECCYYVCFLHYFALFGGLGLNR